MIPAPDTGRTAEEMRDDLAGELADVILKGGAMSPKALADRLMAGPLAQLQADLIAARAERDGADKQKCFLLEQLLAVGVEAAQLRSRLLQAEMGAEAMRGALDQAEACLSIVEPRSDKAEYLRTLDVVRAALVTRIPAAKQTAAWPAGCIKPNSCSRHRQCMYAGSVEQCRHFGKDLTADVEAALAAKAAPLPDSDTGG